MKKTTLLFVAGLAKKITFAGMLLFCFAATLVKGQVPTSGLTAYWPLDGNANDTSGNGNNGTIHGATPTTDRFGNPNRAYSFNGVNNYIVVPNSPTVNMASGDFSVAFWMKTYANDMDGIPICKNQYGSFSGYLFFTNNTNGGYCSTPKHVSFYTASGAQQDACSDSTVTADTSWHFVVGIFHSTTNSGNLFIDGVLQADVGQSSGPIGNAENLVFGAHNILTTLFYSGALDDIRLYNRALDSTEIGQLYVEGGYNPNPVITPPPVTINSPGNYLDTLFDRLGNKHTLTELRVNTTTPYDVGGRQYNTVSSTQVCGYFNLYFETGSGMDIAANPIHVQRRAVLCQLMTDLSAFINTPLPPGSYINVWVRDIANMGVGPNALGVASGFYAVPANSPNGGITDNMVWKTLISGVDGYTNVASPLVTIGSGAGFYHAAIAFNFGFPWNLSTTACSAPSDFDLYSVGLHEMTHTLGFASLINVNGLSRLPYPFDYYYSRYDLKLKTSATQIPANTPLIVNTGACSGLYNYKFNPLLNTTILGNNCTGGSSNNTNCPDALYYQGSATVPVYTPNSPNCYEPGSSLSHFEDQCYPSGTPYGNDLYFVMSNANGPGPTFCKRYLKPEERLVLCDLGYNVNASYGVPGNPSFHNYGGAACNNDMVVGVNDGIAGGAYTHTTTYGTPINITGFLGNDVSTLSNVVIGKCYEIVSGTGSITASTTTSFTYTPVAGGTGETILVRYIPVDALGTEGSITYIFIRVNGVCPATPCNMLSNGNFESSSVACGEIPGSPSLTCWSHLYGTPDLYIRGCGNTSFFVDYDASGTFQNPGNAPIKYNLGTSTFNSTPAVNSHGNIATNLKAVGLACRVQHSNMSWHESMETTLTTPLVAGQQYNLSFWASTMNSNYVNSGTALVPNAKLEFRSSPALLVSNSNAIGLTYPATTTVLTNTVIPNDYQWHYVSVNFTAGTNDGYFLMGYPDNFLVSPNDPPHSYVYTVFDDIRLLPATTAGTFVIPNTTICSNQVLPDLSIYVSPGGGTFSGPGVVNTGGIYSFDPSISGPGLITLDYTYTDINGCTQVVSTQVNVVTNTLTVTVPNVQNCAGSCSLVTATSNNGTSYTWSDGTTGASHTDCVPLSGSSVSYTVTVTNAAGCVVQGISTATVQNCNCTGAPVFTATTGAPAAGTYVLNSNLTLTGTLSLANVIIAIAPNVKITVPNGKMLNIVASHLYSCNDMWDSIIIQPGGRIRTGNNTLIEDAKTAINSTGAPLTSAVVMDISNTIFNTCGTGITIANYTFTQPTYPYNIVGSVFTSRKLWGSGTAYTASSWPTVAFLTNTNPPPPTPYTGPYIVGRSFVSANLKAPLNIPAQVAGAGINLVKVGAILLATPGTYTNKQIQIGSTAGTQYRNVFDNLHYGMAAKNSNFLCVNNAFQNMIGVGFLFPNTFGYGIFGVATEFHSARVLTPGNMQNVFYDCRRSIDLTGYTEAYLDDSYITSSRVTPTPGSIGSTPTGIVAISWKSATSVTIEVNNNTIYNHQVGIGLTQDKIAAFSGAQSQVQGPITVMSNLLQANVGSGSPTTQSLGTGIVCNNLLTCTSLGPNCNVTTSGPVTITSNVVSKGLRGIQANNWHFQQVTIFGNNVGMLQEPNTFFGAPTDQWGIYHANSTNGIIDNNTVAGTAITKDPYWKGIYVNLCTGTEVRCNAAITLPRGIVFDGTNTGTTFWDNSMRSCKYGYALQNNGVIGPQQSALQPKTSDNEWLNFVSGSTYKTLCDASISTNSPLYVHNTPVYRPAAAFNTTLGVAVGYNAAGALNTSLFSFGNRVCGGNSQRNANLNNRIAVLESIVQNLLPYAVFPLESNVLNRRNAFRAIQQDNSLLSSSLVLQSFYNDNVNAANGQFSVVESNLLNQNVSAAQASLNSINPTNSVDAKTKEFYRLYINAKNNALSASDSLALDSLAGLCVTQYGAMVHQARVLYNLVFDTYRFFSDNCVSSGSGSTVNTREVQVTDIPQRMYGYIVFPNPSSGEVRIGSMNESEELTVSIQDISGKTVYTGKLNVENRQANLKLDVENGVYLMSIDNGEIKEMQKLIIAK